MGRSWEDLEVEKVDEEEEEVTSSIDRSHKRPEKRIFGWWRHCNREDGDHKATEQRDHHRGFQQQL